MEVLTSEGIRGAWDDLVQRKTVAAMQQQTLVDLVSAFGVAEAHLTAECFKALASHVNVLKATFDLLDTNRSGGLSVA